jgi:hypothetical protein
VAAVTIPVDDDVAAGRDEIEVGLIAAATGGVTDASLPGVDPTSGTGDGCNSPWSGTTAPKLLFGRRGFEELLLFKNEEEEEEEDKNACGCGKGTCPALDRARYSLKAIASSALTAGTGTAKDEKFECPGELRE